MKREGVTEVWIESGREENGIDLIELNKSNR